MLSQRVSGSRGLTQKHFSSEQHITQIEMYFPLNFSRLFIRLLGSHLHYLISYQLLHSNLESNRNRNNFILLSVMGQSWFCKLLILAASEVFLVLVFQSAISLSFIYVVDISIILPVFQSHCRLLERMFISSWATRRVTSSTTLHICLAGLP